VHYHRFVRTSSDTLDPGAFLVISDRAVARVFQQSVVTKSIYQAQDQREREREREMAGGFIVLLISALFARIGLRVYSPWWHFADLVEADKSALKPVPTGMLFDSLGYLYIARLR